MTMTPPLMWIDAGVVSLTVATDEAPHFDSASVDALSAALARAATDTSIGCVVLEGGPRYFSAGASRESLLAPNAADAILTHVSRILWALLALPVPTVAAMAGHAVGGGLMLGLWCDVAVPAEESLYGANFMALGFTPGMGATVVMEEAFGAPLARELLFTGRLMKGRELREWGAPLAYNVVPRDHVRERARAIAREIAGMPRDALVLLKKSVATRRREPLQRALREEYANHAELFARDEIVRGIAERYPSRDAPPARRDER
jgi:enoyl-CoA hydratase/carnithine racemase